MENLPIPVSKIDEDIGKYILNNPDGNFSNIIAEDGRWEVFRELGGRYSALFSWYPFKKNSSVLQINAGFGSITDFLCRKCESVTAVEKDEFKAYCLLKRCEKYSSLKEVRKSFHEINNTFDYIIYTDDESTAFTSFDEYKDYICFLKEKLKADGKLLFAAANRLGIKYLCGESYGENGRPFDGIADNIHGAYRFGRKELENMLCDLGFEKVKLYYPLPDYETAQLIYTDECQPERELNERLRPYILNKQQRVINERQLYEIAAENGSIPLMSNTFIAECGNDVSSVIYAALSSERSPDQAFATVIFSDNIVKKIPIYYEGVEGLQRLLKNTKELAKKKIPVLDIDISDGNGVMKRILLPTLADYLRSLSNSDKNEFLHLIDRLYDYILKSSDIVSADKNELNCYAPSVDWGPILKKAYFEMIPVNCFYTNNDFVFYDQEFSAENYPAKFVLFRALRDIYAFIPETEKIYPLSEMKKRYAMEQTWDYFQRAEWEFQNKLRRWDVYKNHFRWLQSDENAINRNRRNLVMLKDNESISVTEDIFNITTGLGDKKVVIFGAGKMLDYYLENYGDKAYPEFIVDNDSKKWGIQKNGIEIKAPDILKELPMDKYRIVIASNYYEQITEQLENMGISERDYRVYTRFLDELKKGALTDTITDGKYNIGYVTGAFDLFHIGHLNVLKNSKSKCHYLIVGVLTDEIIRDEKHVEPVIPFEERIEIVKQCRYVDRVVVVDKHNSYKINAWKELRFGCLFSGNDHEMKWKWLQKQLRSLGSNLEFFPYTPGTSSTMLKAVLKDRVMKRKDEE